MIKSYEERLQLATLRQPNRHERAGYQIYKINLMREQTKKNWAAAAKIMKWLGLVFASKKG